MTPESIMVICVCVTVVVVAYVARGAHDLRLKQAERDLDKGEREMLLLSIDAAERGLNGRIDGLEKRVKEAEKQATDAITQQTMGGRRR